MKTILIKGTTDGIGRETARQLLALGHRVLLHGRTRERAQQSLDALGRGAGALAAVPVQPSAHARDDRLAEALWQASTAALQPFLES